HRPRPGGRRMERGGDPAGPVQAHFEQRGSLELTSRLKHRWSISHNYLAGITAGMWWKLLRENRFAVDPAYWHRAVFISLSSLLNSYYRRREDRQFAEEIEAVRITQPPLFILGHWR